MPLSRIRLAHFAPFALTALALLAANLAFLNLHPGNYTVDVGNFRDFIFVDGAYQQEVVDGASYRWTTAQTTLTIDRPDTGPHAALTLHLGGRPTSGTVKLAVDGHPFGGFLTDTAPRRYALLLPDDPSPPARLAIQSDTFSAPGDPRRPGVRLDGFTVAILNDAPRFPAAPQILAQIVVLACLLLIARRLDWRPAAQSALGVLAAIGLAALLASEFLLASSYLLRLAGAAVALALLTRGVLPLFERLALDDPAPPGAPSWGTRREMRLLWALMIAACVIRLGPILYPTFGGQDLDRNVNRFIMTITGQLVIIAPSAEFARGLTIYPPGPYLALMPLALMLRDLDVTLQGPLALLDGTTAFLTALIARRLGAGPHGARLALVLYAGNLAAFAGLSYSFSAQVFGQWFTAPIALVLMASLGVAPRPRTWLLVALLTLMALLSHIGVAFLAGAWMVLAVGVVSLAHRRLVWQGATILALAGAFAFGLLYIEIFAETLRHATAEVLPGEAGALFPGYRPLMINGLRLAYSDPGLALIPLGIALALNRAPGETWSGIVRRQAPVLAALLAVALYWLVALRLDVQVRFFYFSLPFVLAAMGLALGRLADRGTAGRIVGWALTLAVAIPPTLLWFQATLADGKIPLTPLTH